MGIQNNTIITKNEIRKFAFENIKKNTVKPLIFLMVALAVLSAILIAEGSYMEALLWICGTLGFMVLVFIVTLIITRSQLKISKISEESTYYTYQFLDDEIEVSSKNHMMDSHVKISYQTIYQVTENDAMIYIWLDKVQAYIVSKKGFENSLDLETVKQMLAKYERVPKKRNKD